MEQHELTPELKEKSQKKSSSLKGNTKITDFWKSPSIELDSPIGDEVLEKSLVNSIKSSNKSPCFDLTNKDNGKESKRDFKESEEDSGDFELFKKKKKAEFSEGGVVKKMKIDDNGTDSMESEIVNNGTEPKALLGKSPRKSQRNTPVKSYKELDKYLYEEKKPGKAKNRTLEKFREFFKKTSDRPVGRPPKEPKKPILTTPSSEKLPSVSRDLHDERRSLPNVTPKRRGRPPASEEEKEAKKAEYKKKLSEKLKEKRRLDREAKERSKALHDDLLLDTLKPLPKLTPIEFSIPNEGLGDFFCILEFFSAYSQELSVKDYFSQGVTIDILERAFTETDAMGLLVNVVQILLGSLVKLEQKDWTVDYSVRNDGDEPQTKIALLQEKASLAGAEFRETYGYMFHYAPLDSFTFSDVLRYHFKASGAPGIDLRDRIHCHQGFTPKEDPGLIFVRDHPDIMAKLDSSCVSNLNVLEKIKVVRCLIDQLLTFELFRDTIEEGLERCVELKVQLKKLHWRKKMLEDEDKSVKRDMEDGTNEDEKKRKNWRYDLPNMPLEEIEQQIEATERDIEALWYRFGLSSLGEDRSHRLYSIMHSIPAIVVETVPTTEAPCMIGGTPPRRKEEEDSEMETEEDSQKTAVETEPELICTGSKTTCIIHGRNTSRFEFVLTVEQLDALQDALADKGVRENILKETITAEYDFLRNTLKKTPASRLNQSLTDQKTRKYQTESFKPSNVHGIQPDLALSLTFRELLLDIEEKAIQGSLGGFKEDKDVRLQWRTDLESPLLQMQNQSPEETNKLFLDLYTGQQEVEKMAGKLLEFCDTIPTKFLKAPLGEQGVTLRNKLENWRNALPNCLNFSQLFIFYSSLENSIQWQKGLTNARCAICRGKATPERMVRCETCDCVFHLSCCKPALREIPPSPWFCKGCTPDNVPDSPRKKPRVLAEDAEDSLSELPDNNDYCEVCLKDEKLLSCDYCPRSFHLDCIDLKRAPRGEWQCFACQLGAKKYKLKLKELRKQLEDQAVFTNIAEIDEVAVQNQCLKCGELLSRGHIECLGCGRKYHLACADLPKRPKNDWYCKKRCEPGYVEPSVNQFPAESSDEEIEEEQVSEVDGKPQSELDVFDNEACSDILEVLRKSDHAWPFLEPVSRKDAPDYFKIIKKPMDLSTIHTKLNDMKYSKNSTFINDIMQIFKNCEEYNTEEAEVYKEGKRLLELFVSLIENYSLQNLLVTGQFKWLDDYMNNRCTKCEVPFSASSKTVTCSLCTSQFHPKCAALKVIPVKWECPKCAKLDEAEREQLQQSQQSPPDDKESLSKLVDVTGFDFKECTEVIGMLLKDFLSVPFRRPVTKKEAPDYFEIIKSPIDLATIKHSLNHMKYNSNKLFVDELVLMFDNCERYNSEKSSIYGDAHRLWEKLMKRFEETGFITLVDKSNAPKWNLPKMRR